MRRPVAVLAALLGSVLAAAPARAQDETGGEDEKRLSTDSSESDSPAPKKKKKKKATAEEELDDKKEEESLSRLDDPKLGLSAELAGTWAFLNKSYGPGLVGSPVIGVRVDWAVGRLWTDPADEFWKYALLAEIAYDYAPQSAGTQAVNTSSAYHFVSFRGLMGYPIKDYLLFYGALGGGFTVESINYQVEGTSTGISAVEGNFDYGLGGRLRIAITPSIAIATRLEVMRIRRNYLDDTFITLSAGVDF